jgi:hypothetical protein
VTQPSNSDQGTQVAAFIDGQVSVENARQESLNSRAATALTGATGLVTLILAVGAYFVGNKASATALMWLTAAMIALLLSAACAVVASWPWHARVLSTNTMRDMLTEHWQSTETSARNFTSQANVTLIESLRASSRTKTYFLVLAGVLQALAVTALMTCALMVFTTPAKPRSTDELAGHRVS